MSTGTANIPNPLEGIYRWLLHLLGNSTLHKIAGAVAAGFGAFAGPGVASAEHTLVTAAGAAYATAWQLIDSIWNSAKGSPPGTAPATTPQPAPTAEAMATAGGGSSTPPPAATEAVTVAAGLSSTP